MIKGFYGLIIAVKNLDEAVANYEAMLGGKPEYLSGYEARLTKLDAQGIDSRALAAVYDFATKGAIFELPGFRIELVTSADENSIVGKFLKKRGEGVLLVSLEVADIEKVVEQLRARGRKLLLEKNADGILGKTNLVHPKSMNGVQFEIFQPAGNPNK